MLTDIENQRMLKAQSNRINTNCIGTVLYIFGAIEKDEYIGIEDRRWGEGIVNRFLEGFVKTDEPAEDSVLVLRRKSDKRIEHMGVFIGLDPPKVYHRPGCDKKIQPNEELFKVTKKYQNHPIHEFYTKLDSIKNNPQCFHFI